MENIDYEAVHDELFIMLEDHMIKELSLTLAEMNEFDISEFLGELWETDKTRMAMVFRLLSKEIAADVFANLEVEEQETIINSITDTELGDIIEDLAVDDAVDMMEELPANVVKRVMRTTDAETRALINKYLKYPENGESNNGLTLPLFHLSGDSELYIGEDIVFDNVQVTNGYKA